MTCNQKYDKSILRAKLIFKRQTKFPPLFFPIIRISLLIFFFSAGAILPSNAQSNDFNLIGKVIDEKSEFPLGGATVQIKGAYHEVIADNDGNFIIKAETKFPVILLVMYVGYDTKEITVVNAEKVTVGLTENKTKLTEVVVVGYGAQRKSDITGSVASVSKNLLTQPAASFDNLLQGAVPGVAVTQSSGQPGSTATIRIRGGNSISFGNDPLYVIDGFIVYNNNAYTNSGASNGASINALSTINPSDIESVEILKDASATAIYGSRGANGVVLITTRRGKKGSDDISYNVYMGTQQAVRKLSLLNASEWGSLVNDINRSENKPVTFSDSALTALGAGSDWQNAALRSATIQNHELSFSGGDDRSRYLISGNYFSQDGTVLNTGFKRYSARVNYERNITEKLKIAANVFGSKTIENKLYGNPFSNINSGAYSTLIFTSPVAKIWNADGTYNTTSPYSTTPTNPLQDITASTNKSYITRVLGNFSGEYKLIADLTLKVTGGADLISTKQNYYAPSYTGAVAGNSNGYTAGGYASVGNVTAATWLNENTLTYDHAFKNTHFLNILAGYTTQYQKDESAVASAQKFPNDLTDFNNLNYAATAVLPSSDAHTAVLNSYLGRVNYSYLHKYNITISGRADGSSKLGANNRWGFFPSAGLSWNVSDEDFFTVIKTTVNNLKLRFSGGQTGNSEVPPYSSLAALTPTNYYFNSALVTGIAPVQVENPNLKWETTTQYNAGIDLGIFKNRIKFVFDVYHKKTTDLLLNVPFPLYTGYASVLQNVGSVQNKGVEFSIMTDNIKGVDLTWKSSIVFAVNRNKVLSLGEGTGYFFPLAPVGQVSPVIVQVGLPVGTFWGYATNGLLTADDITKGVPLLAGVSQQEGDRKYVDFNGDGIITTSDKHDLGSSQSKFTFGFSNNIAYKGFDLSFIFQGSYGNKIFNLLQQRLEIPTLSLNASATLLDRWTTTNTGGTVPKATNSPVPQVIDRYIEDGSFVKLKNISLGYTLPKSVLSKMHAKQVRIYVSAQNLLTITNYTGYDPEVNYYDSDNTRQGVDNGLYPSTRAFLAGLNVTF